MTVAIALVPLLFTPVIFWLLLEYGPERSTIFVLHWLLISIVFAIAMPWFRRRGRSLAKASVFGAVVALLVTSLILLTLLFGFTLNARAMSTLGAVR